MNRKPTDVSPWAFALYYVCNAALWFAAPSTILSLIGGVKLDPKGNFNTHFYLSFESERKNKEPQTQYYTLDSEYIPALFKKAADSSWNKSTAFPQGLGELNHFNMLRDLKNWKKD